MSVCDISNCQITTSSSPPKWSRFYNGCVYNSSDISEFDMRRKAEILKYKNNNSNLSKKQLWARKIKGYGQYKNKVWATQNINYTNNNINNLERSNDTLLCPNSQVNCALTTYSDVPGRQIILCDDNNVNLVNYIVKRRYLSGDGGTSSYPP